jgi:hypothetical protein
VRAQRPDLKQGDSNIVMAFIFFTLLSMFDAAPAGAPSVAAQAIAEKLSAARVVNCTFTTMASGTWNGGVAVAETKASHFSLGFDEIDADQGTARVIGAFGPSDIIVRLSAGTLHFVQAFREGPLYATTIFPQESQGAKLKAVHTRHEYTEVRLPGFTSRPEQYYGDCEIVR